jgi:class 3 adenylate cyclase
MNGPTLSLTFGTGCDIIPDVFLTYTVMKQLLLFTFIAGASEAMAQDVPCAAERAAMVDTIRAYARSEADVLGPQGISERVLEAMRHLREVISTYQKCVADTVRSFGGFVAQYMGDGVLIYFGYPQAHEDDAERAVRAGLELVAAVGDLKTHAALQARVGVATGMGVVGDLIGSGASQQQAIVGETSNLAARLQGMAP